jgi:hypothetical protein
MPNATRQYTTHTHINTIDSIDNLHNALREHTACGIISPIMTMDAVDTRKPTRPTRSFDYFFVPVVVAAGVSASGVETSVRLPLVISAIKILNNALTATLPSLSTHIRTGNRHTHTHNTNARREICCASATPHKITYNNVQSNKLPLRRIGNIFFACSLSVGSPPLMTIYAKSRCEFW